MNIEKPIDRPQAREMTINSSRAHQWSKEIGEGTVSGSLTGVTTRRFVSDRRIDGIVGRRHCGFGLVGLGGPTSQMET